MEVAQVTDLTIKDVAWSDYVFQDDYSLKPLSEVDSFIKEHKHLPGIPSEREVEKQGVNVGEMQAKLLAKIEELTLHLIEQNNKITELQRELTVLKKQD